MQPLERKNLAFDLNIICEPIVCSSGNLIELNHAEIELYRESWGGDFNGRFIDVKFEPEIKEQSCNMLSNKISDRI